MDTFDWKPAPGASQTTKPTVELAKYGDGYEQRVGWGIHGLLDKWSLKFTTDVSEIYDFLRLQGGQYSFIWTNPLGVSGVYICREWKLNHVGADIFAVSCDFEEVPE